MQRSATPGLSLVEAVCLDRMASLVARPVTRTMRKTSCLVANFAEGWAATAAEL